MAPRLCCEVTPMLNTSCASSTTNSMTRQQHACKERKDVLDIFGSSPRRGSEGGPAEGPGSGRHCKSPARGGGPRGRPTWQARPTRRRRRRRRRRREEEEGGARALGAPAARDRVGARIPCQRPVLAAHPNSILAGIARANSSADARACFTRWRSTGTWSEHIARAV
ncbi:unnamed protein product [Prorocentrum cordatum]|uniref:Uncharacterized protein n=1 Tax=Prorocentrum cordatum TaxID=2364126 RepID=A0ABN9PHW6_9DINO|nr:unnamed protein product [Polarella glacialis]